MTLNRPFRSKASLVLSSICAIAVFGFFASNMPSVAARASALVSSVFGPPAEGVPTPPPVAPPEEIGPAQPTEIEEQGVASSAAAEAIEAVNDPAAEKTEAEGDADLPGFFKGKIDKAEYKRARAGHVAMLLGYDTMQADSRAKALKVQEQQEAALGLNDPSQTVSPTLNASTWSFVGPNPIPNGQTTAVSTAVSGRVSAIAVDPTDANIVYAGAAQGGVYRSLDGGTTWTPLMDNALTLAIGAIAIAPSNPSIVYVGTGEASGSVDGFVGVGIYRITNATSGSPVVEGPFNKDALLNDVMTFRSVSKILVHPTNPDLIYVTTASGVGGNPGAGPTVTLPARGLFRSTNATAAAPTFARLTVNPTLNAGSLFDAVMDPGDPETILVTVTALSTTPNDGGVWRTTNASAPTPTFTRTLNLTGTATATIRSELAINRVAGVTTVYAATGENVTAAANGCSATAQGALRKSTDGGATFGAIMGSQSRGFCNGQCFYDIFVGVDPGDANKIYLGGAADNTGANPCRASISLRSTDGTTFTRNSNGLHADSHAVAIAPSNPSVVYTGNDGGIYKSTDSGANWTSLNNSFFSATQFQSIAVHPRDSTFTIGGTQDNGTNGMNSAGTWNRVDFGDGGYALIDQNAYDTNSMTMYHTYFNQANSLLGFGRVTPGQAATEGNWTFLGFGGTPNGIVNENVLFYAPIALGPGNPNTLYYAARRLYRSTNQGTTMTQVSQILTQNISTIAISPQNDNVRLIGLIDGTLFGTNTGANPLTNLGAGNAPALPARAVTRVAIDPNNTSVAYALYGGWGLAAGQHVWKTTAFGTAATWVPSGSGIPDVPVDSIVVDPTNSNNVFVGTDIGVYWSQDAGATWNPLGSGLPRVAVFDLAIQSQNRILRIATHGRGMWELLIPGATTPVVTLSAVHSAATITSGNGNSVIEPGEIFSFSSTLSNSAGSNATASAVNGTLTSATVGASVLSGSSAYANIAPGGSSSNATPFSVGLSPTAVCGAPVTLPLSVAYTGDALSPRAFTAKFTTGAPSGVTNTIPYAGAPVFIPDSPSPGSSATLTVSGITNAISKLRFSIDGTSCNTTPASTTVGLDHTFVGDLTIRLTSPTGTVIRLTNTNGNAGVNFCQTVFDDAAATAWSSATAASAPFTGSFRPVDPLSTFAGENANGTWTVSMVDGGGGDTGTLRAFSLLIEQASCAPVPPPTAVTGSATGVTATGATLNGAVNPNTFPSSGSFEYGLTTSYGTSTTLQSVGSGVAPIPVSETIGSLTPGFLYHYRINATYALGTINGFDQTFTTSCPTITLGSLLNGTQGVAYTGSVAASGGTGPYNYSVTFGSLPPGLTLVGTGAGAGGVSGTPTTTGTYNFDVTATDTAGIGTCTGVRSYTVHVGTSILAGDLIVREFRWRGPAGLHDEFVEVMNKTATAVTVAATDGSSGYAVLAEGVGTLGTIPNGTVVPAGGFYLLANNTAVTGYSLANYGGAGAAAADLTWSTDVPDNTGVALFRSSSTTDMTTRLDAIGFTSSSALYTEGTGLPPVPGGTGSSEVTYARVQPGAVTDTGNNAADVTLLDTNAGTFPAVGPAILGAPGPENLLSPRDSGIVWSLADPTKTPQAFPNRFRISTPNTYFFRWKVTNNTGGTINQLRVRVGRMTTLNSPLFNSPLTQFDFRLVTSPDVVITVPVAGSVTAKGLTLEPPVTGLPLNGGNNASVTVSIPGGLLNGGSMYVNVGLQYPTGGSYYIYYVTGEGKP